MKKILLLVFVLFLSISAASAFVFDNVKTNYDSSTEEITISNSFLRIFPTSEIATAKLITPRVNHVMPGNDRLVAEFNIDLNEDIYKDFLTNMELYNNYSGKVLKEERNIKLKAKKITTFDETEYYTECSQSGEYYGNGSAISSCSRLQRIVKTEKIEWIDLDYDLNKGNTSVGIFADVYQGDRIEWIPTIMGVRVSEWSTWDDGLTNGLILYFNMNNATMNGTTVMDQLDNYPDVDGVFNGEVTGNITSGILGDSVNLSGSSSTWIQVKSAVPKLAQNFSTNAWFYATDSSNPLGLMGRTSDDGTTNRDWRLWYGAGDSNPGTLYEFIERDTDSTTRFTTGNLKRSNKWTMITITHNVSGIYLYENGTYISSTLGTWNIPVAGNFRLGWACGAFGGGCHEFEGRVDEVGYWNRTLTPSEVNQLYNSGNGITYSPTIPPLNVTSTLISPVNNTSLSNTTWSFQTNITVQSGNSVNETLYIWYQNSTLFNTSFVGGLSGTNNTINWTVPGFSEGIYKWNALACGQNSTDSLCKYAVNNFTIAVDTTAPVLNLSAPSNPTNYHKAGLNLSLNWSVSDALAGLSSCWYEYDNINTTVTCANNNATFNVTDYSIRKIKFFANDTVNNVAYNTRNWNYTLFEWNRTYNLVASEISTQTYSINVSYDNLSYSSITGYLNFNNSQYITTSSGSGENKIFSNTLVVPAVNANINKTIYWTFVLANSTGSLNITTLSSNQTIRPFVLDDCSSGTTLILNYTLRDEDTQTFLTTPTNTTVEVSVLISSLDNSVTKSFNLTKTNTNPVKVCVDSNIFATDAFRLDTIASYFATDRVKEFHHMQNVTLNSTNILQQITLFDLLTTESQSFLISLKDANFLPSAGALIDITRKYISEGVFKSVEVPKTDANGQTIAHLVLEDAVYSILVKKEGVLLATFENIIAVCQDVSTGQCTLNLNLLSSSTSPRDWRTEGGLTYAISTNYNSKVITLTYTSTDSSPKTVFINATKFDTLGNTTICSDTLTSTSGTLTCTVPATFGNTTVKTNIYVNGNYLTTKIDTFGENPNEIFGYTGIVLLVVMFGMLPFFFIASPIGMIIAAMMSIIAAAILNIYTGGGIIGVGSTALWFVVAGLIILWKIVKEGSG